MGGASSSKFRGGQSRDIFRGGPVKKITLYIGNIIMFIPATAIKCCSIIKLPIFVGTRHALIFIQIHFISTRIPKRHTSQEFRTGSEMHPHQESPSLLCFRIHSNIHFQGWAMYRIEYFLVCFCNIIAFRFIISMNTFQKDL